MLCLEKSYLTLNKGWMNTVRPGPSRPIYLVRLCGLSLALLSLVTCRHYTAHYWSDSAWGATVRAVCYRKLIERIVWVRGRRGRCRWSVYGAEGVETMGRRSGVGIGGGVLDCCCNSGREAEYGLSTGPGVLLCVSEVR